MPMSHRERVIQALQHEEPDRVPFDLGSTVNSTVHIAEYQNLKAYFGIEAEDTIIHKPQQVVAVHEPILQALDIDFRYVSPGGPDNNAEIPVGDDGYRDQWGIVRRKPPGCLYYDPVQPPLGGQITIHDIVHYPWPDPYDPGYTRGLRDRLLAYRQHTDFAVVLRLHVPFVQTAQLLRGFEDWFLDLAMNQKLAAALFDAIVERTSALAEEILKVGGDLAEVVAFSDDLGFQNGPMFSPALYRQLFKPRHKKYLDSVRKHTKACILFHSCGSVYQLLNDFIELGVDAINPVQVAAKDMDSAILGPEFGTRLSFWGGIDTQQVLPYGTTDEVKAEVKQRLKDFAPGGGYVLNAVHNLQPGVPVENIIALYEAGKEYGRYPLCIE